MRDIIDLIEADHLHIMRWAARLGELSRQDSDQELVPVLAGTWQTLAGLIELHTIAEEATRGLVGNAIRGELDELTGV